MTQLSLALSSHTMDRLQVRALVLKFLFDHICRCSSERGINLDIPMSSVLRAVQLSDYRGLMVPA
jgi:hypothetical protein